MTAVQHVAGFVLLIIGLSGCTHDPAPASVSDQRLHAVMTESLNLELARLDTLTFDLHRTPTELDRERERRLDDIERAATRLQRSAMQIGGLTSTLSLDPYQSDRFNALAHQLADEAEALAEAARQHRQERLSARITRMRSTCDSCHSLYRDQ